MAVAVCVVATSPRVQVDWARPLALVGPLAGANEPLLGVAQVTVTPGTGLPKASRGSTTSGSGSTEPAGPVCASPLIMRHRGGRASGAGRA